MLKLRFILTLLFLHLATLGFSQNETNNWYFGNQAGLQFDNLTVPAPLVDGSMNTREGCSTISDTLGNLLFYTDGVKVWNRLHNQMANGYGLMGNTDASQSAMIIKKPGSSNIYYIFTVAARVEQPGFRYSTVDMSLNGGLGDVIQKNVALLTPATEKITAVSQRNDHDVWVIAHGWNSNAIYAYPVTNTGVGTPVISNIGQVHGGLIENSQGCMKVSPDGTRLAQTIENQNMIEIFNFNDQTGIVSDPKSFITPGYRWAYGVEFSQDGTHLYFTSMGIPGSLFWVKLDTDDPLTINHLRQTNAELIGALQLGKDGNIYLAVPNKRTIGRITHSSVLGSGPVFNEILVPLSTSVSNLGLPSFNQNFFLKPSFEYEHVCIGDTTKFKLRVPHKFNDVTWNFGDTASGQSNTATGYNPTHQFSAPGLYTITVSGKLNNGKTRTGVYRLNIVNLPVVNLGPDTIICPGSELVLKPDSSFAKYYWSTGDSVPSITITEPGTYTLTAVSTAGCVNTDTIEVKHSKSYILFSPKIYETCYGESVAIHVNNTNATNIIWPDSSTGPAFVAEQAGKYKVSYDMNGCTFQDSVEVVYINCPDKFKIPNVFTPNNDQQNDVFIIQGLAPGNAELSIYNRWGKEVFKSAGYMQNWNGENEGAGTYYYILRIPETNEVYKGWVELIR